MAAQLIVLVEEIGEEGLDVTRALPRDFLDGVLSGDGRATGFSARGPATLSARLEKVSGEVLLSGRASLSIGGECKRCLKDVEGSVELDFKLDLVKRPGAKARDEKDTRREREGEADSSFGPEATEQELFDGREIDLGPIVREQVLLALPMDLVCREDCKGLCAVCGTNLNEKACGCEKKPADPRWAALKDIKLA